MQKTRVAIVSTVKAPIEVLRSWIQYHRNIGIGRFILFQDDPGDGMREKLAGIEQATVIPCDRKYWAGSGADRPGALPPRQVINLVRGLALAKDMGCGWAAHVDCDELIRPLGSLADVLGATDAAALKMTVLEAVSERSEYRSIFDASLFKKVPTRTRAIAARLMGCRRAFSHGELFRGHTASKSLVKTDGSIVKMGVHKPLELATGATIAETADIQLLHFDCTGFADWDQKWRARANDKHATWGLRPARRRQLKAYQQAARDGYEQRVRLFRNTQMIPAREQAVLNRLGLLTRIELDRRLFDA